MSYRDLKSYQQAIVIYDLTAEFCSRYIDGKSRTRDQMVQAARSGKQNIAEGSANPTSEKSELKLLGVARASFQELLEDYEDFLRQRGLRQWNKDEPAALVVRNLYKSNQSDRSNMSNRTNSSYVSYLSDPAFAANAAICLINQVNFLLDRQLKALEAEFVSRGGYGEKMSRRREEEIKKKLIGRTFRKFE